MSIKTFLTTGAVGAIDTGAPAFFFDPTLPALPYVNLLVVSLDLFAHSVTPGARFAELTPDGRDQALAAAIEAVDLMAFALQLVKLAFYSSKEAGQALGYPGANPGYVNDANFSFNRPMSREVTSDGNYP
jgi:hypothetical protein